MRQTLTSDMGREAGGHDQINEFPRRLERVERRQQPCPTASGCCDVQQFVNVAFLSHSRLKPISVRDKPAIACCFCTSAQQMRSSEFAGGMQELRIRR